MSLLDWLTPWKPATIAMAPSATACSIRPGVTSMIFALPCVESVMTPAWEPVNDALHAAGVGDGRAAVLLHHDAHAGSFVT
jgi:hypothetical protein